MKKNDIEHQTSMGDLFADMRTAFIKNSSFDSSSTVTTIDSYLTQDGREMKKIRFQLHKVGNSLLLKSDDIYNSIKNPSDDFVVYISKWCAYLNWRDASDRPLNVTFSALEGWIEGYSYAKNITVEYPPGHVQITTSKYEITLPTPFII